ncbi:Imm50 family immunity protein [Streptomyces wuyuanensis]|uniref:Imm50 family immunity protein n=1 Tax=Streptomyces wuyuanensis TaxID=1196353 RepID=UPI0037176599
MAISDWTNLLTDPRGLTEVFSEVPALGHCFLYSVHIDERDRGITLGFDTRSVPDRPRPEWLRTEFNAFEFFLTFTQVTELSLHGWDSVTDRTAELSRSPRGGITVHVANSREAISFHASYAHLSLCRVYLASSSD